MRKELVKLSKFLSLVLRHEPHAVGVTLDSAGWVSVDELLAACARHGTPISRETLEEIVETNEKKRLAFSDDRQRIRASQGHSVEVDLGYSSMTPPDTLYHGTADRFLPAILQHGLMSMNRHAVHLSDNPASAVAVGQRHGKPILLRIDARSMHAAGHTFHLSANGVWLTDSVPSRFLSVMPSDRSPSH